MNWQRVADVVRARRRELRLTQQDAVIRAGSGVSLAVWNNLENARQESYRPSTLAAVARALNWTVDSIDRAEGRLIPTGGPGEGGDRESRAHPEGFESMAVDPHAPIIQCIGNAWQDPIWAFVARTRSSVAWSLLVTWDNESSVPCSAGALTVMIKA
jgi:transcriptional regulator with XRE-family HTH domain